MKKIYHFTKIHKEALLVCFLLALSALAFGVNLFHYPYFETDEGTYISQAWAVLTQGRLAPYTYTYDHAPLGWLLIALWVKITGGFSTFGFALNSGRALMLVIHILSTALLYFVAKRLTNKVLPAVIAVIIFSFSPLGIIFERRTLLDNIMTFWVLVTFALLLVKKLKLRYVTVSAVTLALSVLSKETAIFFIPGFVYLLYTNVNKKHKIFAITTWIFLSFAFMSLYPVYALLKGEFFPVGMFDNTTAHVSLVTSWLEQTARGNSIPFWSKQSDFYESFKEWITRDPFLMIAGILATVMSLIIAIKEKSFRIITLFNVFFWLYLLRGKLVIDFYIIPLLPFLALSIGLVLGKVQDFSEIKSKKLLYTLNVILLLVITGILIIYNNGQWTKNETQPQIDAVQWIELHVPKSDYIAIDTYAYVNLKNDNYTNAEVYDKIIYDPSTEAKFGPDKQNLQYILLNHNMLNDLNYIKDNPLEPEFRHAVLLKAWKPVNSTTYVNTKAYISTYGDWAQVYQVKPEKNVVLDNAWGYFKTNYIHGYGQVINPQTGNTSSEDQADAMLRAVMENDKPMFNGVWAWTHDHLQYRTQDKLFSSLWLKTASGYKLGVWKSAANADEDIALSLIFAYRQWGNQVYISDAKAIISDIWNKEVISVNGHYYLTSGSDAKTPGGEYLINTAYLSPATYHIFALIDPKHPWNALSSDSYALLNTQSRQKNGTFNLPPSVIAIDPKTGSITTVSKSNSMNATDGTSSIQELVFRIGLDALWFNNTNAKSFLTKIEPILLSQSHANVLKKEPDAKPVSQASFSANFENEFETLMVLRATNNSDAQTYYANVFRRNYNVMKGYWGSQRNYLQQNWSWFITAEATK